MNNETFPGFEYTAAEITAYVVSAGTFIMGLVHLGVIRHTPSDPEAFQTWLRYHKIKDISDGASLAELLEYYKLK